MVGVVVVLLTYGAGCGDAAVEESGSAVDQQQYFGRRWHDARLGDEPNQVIVAFTGPDPSGGTGCRESYEPETFAGADDGVVTVLIKVPLPMADLSCPTMLVEIPVKVREVDEFAEGDVLKAGISGYRYRLNGEHFELIPESTPCGRMDCSTTSPTPAPCTTEEYIEAVKLNIDGNIHLKGEQRCDGSFLVTDIDTGSGGCAPVENGPSSCEKLKTAYFVARDGSWSVVSYGEGLTCAQLTEDTDIRFPVALCP